jgi:hypothetical protein
MIKYFIKYINMNKKTTKVWNFHLGDVGETHEDDENSTRAEEEILKQDPDFFSKSHHWRFN